jgi:hypothetical protein
VRAALHAAQPVCAPVTARIWMQSTGHAGTHSPQPVHCASITVCIALLVPTMQSTGQAWMHRVQPMHQSSSITASARGPSAPHATATGRGARPVIAARRRTPSAPPGGQRSMSASPAAMACA